MSTPPNAPRASSVRLGLAVGLLAGGVLVLAVALGAPSLSTDRSGLSALIVAIFLGLVAATAGVWAYGLGRVARIVAVVLGVLGAGWCALAVLAGLEAGVPPLRTARAAVGLFLLVLGVLVAPSDPFGRPRPPLRRTLPTAVLTLALPLAVIGVPPSTPEAWVLDRSIADAVTPADVPGSDVAERWRWTGTELVAVEPAGTGLVVLAGEQVTALDGPTGAEVWHWFRQGVHVSEIGVSPDRATVVIRYVAAGVDGLDVLDAITGQRLWSAQPGGHLDAALTRAAELLVTDAAVVLGQGDEGYHAYGLHDGRSLWEQTTGCDSIDIPVSTVLVRREDCEALGDVIGIDSADGGELWRWRSGGPTAPTEFTPTVVGANGALAVRFSRDDEAHVGRVDPVTGEMVDTPQAGAVQLVISSGPWDVLDRRDGPEVVDPATGERAVLSLPGESDMRPWWHTCSAGTEHLWCYVDQRDTDGVLAAVDPVTGQADLTELNLGGDRVQEHRMLPAPGVIAMLVWEGPYPGERDTLIGFTQPG